MLVNEDPEFVTQATLQRQSYFTSIIDQLDLFLLDEVLPTMSQIKTTLSQFDFQMPLNFIMLPKDFAVLF